MNIKKLVLIGGIALCAGCGMGSLGSMGNMSGMFGQKLETQDTSNEVLPLLDGNWKGFCRETLPSIDSQKHCGTYSMKFDKTSGSLNFEFKRDFFDYGILEDVASCPKGSKTCFCDFNETKNKMDCERRVIKRGECEMTLTAQVQGAAVERGASLLGKFTNHFLKVSDVKKDLKYLDENVKQAILPAEKPAKMTRIQSAKSQCENFSKDLDNEHLKTLVYGFDRDTNDKIYFIGTETGSAILLLPFYSPWMAFERLKN